MVIYLELHFYITYFKDYSISTLIWVCACITCICEPMCVCKYMSMMPMYAAVETRGYGVSSFCTFSHSTIFSWNRVFQWTWSSPFWLGWHASVTLLVLPGLHPPTYPVQICATMPSIILYMGTGGGGGALNSGLCA